MCSAILDFARLRPYARRPKSWRHVPNRFTTAAATAGLAFDAGTICGNRVYQPAVHCNQAFSRDYDGCWSLAPKEPTAAFGSVIGSNPADPQLT